MAKRRKGLNHWDEKLPLIKEMAGNVPADEMARRLDVKVASLRVYCSSQKISLRCSLVKPGRSVNTAPKRKPDSLERGVLLADLVANLFDQDFSASDPIGDAIKFLRHKLST